MKANLRPEQVVLLARAGITRIQPGIEALDTELLTLMKKGCTMLQNVQFLKLAAENGLWVAWNLLYGFPGETAEAYARSASLMPKLRHLQPPSNTGRVLADRFSPYFHGPESFGISIEPAAVYGFIYPVEEAGLRRLAYHFDMRSEALEHVDEMVTPMRAERRLWSERHPESALYWEDLGEAVTVTDERWGWQQTAHSFDGVEADLLRLCGRITSWNRIRSELGLLFDEAALRSGIDRLIGHGLLLHEGVEFLALPLQQPGWRRAPTAVEIADAGRRSR